MTQIAKSNIYYFVQKRANILKFQDDKNISY